MKINVKKNWKDLVDSGAKHAPGLTRREMLARGMATGAVSVMLPEMIASGFIKQAFGAINCPAPVRNPGAIAQIFAEGGPTMGARFISEAQAAAMTVGMASNYGISGQANLRRLGPNLVIDSTSPFGATILAGPNGYPGGAAAWQANVLSKVSGGGHLGPFNQDDGAGVNTGLVAGISPFKVSQMGKDIKIRANATPAAFARGLPSSSVAGALTTASLAGVFSLTPAANGLINADAMTAASDASNALAAAFSGIFKTNERKGGAQMLNNAGCGFYGNSAMADPNYGATLFNPANIAALSSKVTLAQLSAAEQALLAAYYQSAMGVAGGIISQYGGRDYHGNNPQTDIAPKDIEEARAIVMFLAACEAANAKGAMIYTSNGQAIADGALAVTANIGGVATALNAPVAAGDAGGSYNAGLILFYNPAGAGPQARFTGTVNATSGNAVMDPAVGSSAEAMAGLYLTALSFINNGSIPANALNAFKAAGVARNTAASVLL
ncbi:hypothetical protein K2X30_10620 [bacterium]|jgi:hypothetical protein|nr:hypothetical protein [bacterium]